MTELEIRYKTLNANLTSTFGPPDPWAVGETRTLAGGHVEICRRGFHCSPTALEAVLNVPNPILATASVSGDAEYQSAYPQKSCHQSMSILSIRNIGPQLRAFALEEARIAIHALATNKIEPSADLYDRLRPHSYFVRSRQAQMYQHIRDEGLINKADEAWLLARLEDGPALAAGRITARTFESRTNLLESILIPIGYLSDELYHATYSIIFARMAQSPASGEPASDARMAVVHAAHAHPTTEYAGCPTRARQVARFAELLAR